MSSVIENVRAYAGVERTQRLIANHQRPLIASLAASMALLVACTRFADVPVSSPTAEATRTPLAQGIVITDPKPHQAVSRKLEVSGRINNPKDPSHTIELFVRDVNDLIHEHPQGGPGNVQETGQDWRGQTEITDPRVHEVVITAVLLDAEGTRLVGQYQKDGFASGYWPGFYGIPRGEIAKASVEVTTP